MSIFLPGIIYIESFLLHVFNANRCSTPAATVFPIPCLCSDFRPILADHPVIVFAVHCDEIHQAAPQPGVELLDELLIPKLLDEAVHLAAPGLAVLDGFTGLVVLRLHRFIPADQFVVVPVIIILVLRDPVVLGYEPLYLVGQQVQICAEPVPLLFQGFCVSEPFLQQGDAVKYVRFVFDEPVGSPDEGFLDIILRQMRCLAMALELAVASVDGPAVLVGRMPHLGPVPASALAALDFAGEDGDAAVTAPPVTPPLDFFLHLVENLRADDGFVVIFHIVLWHFPFIHFRFFGQEVDGEPLPMAPGDVFRDAPAFFLCQAAHDGDEEFALGIERPDVFLLEINLNAPVLELAYRRQAVHGISGKAADRFCDDEVDYRFP